MKTVIEMAEACGIPEFSNNESQAENIMAFADLVRADEREACAKACETKWSNVAERIYGDLMAAAIRARGKA